MPFPGNRVKIQQYLLSEHLWRNTMNKNRIKVTILAATGLLILAPKLSGQAQTISEETSLGGFSYYLDQYYERSDLEEEQETLLLASELNIPKGIAIAKVNDYVRIREGAGTNYTIVGLLMKNAACIVTEVKDGWAKITSGDVTGYISTEYLYLGKEGEAKARQTAKLTAEVTARTVNVRSTPSTLSQNNIITEVTRGEVLEVIDECSKELLTKEDPKAELWVKVVIDNSEGYVSREFVDVAYTWDFATKPGAYTPSALRNEIALEAQSHLGLRYVWGGQSLTTGADCSGFVRAVYQKCGVNISNMDRTSYGMAGQSYGKTVTLAQAQPGDLVFYGNSSGKVDHVALYIGNGMVVHESGYTSGCKISKVNYRKIIKIKNFLD